MDKKIIVVIILGVLVLLGTAGISAYKHGNAIAGADTFYMVSHSEYFLGEQYGQVIARLYDYQGSPITVTNCTVDIWYPDKTPFVSDALTTDTLQTTTGTHYYQFTVPNIQGVYQYMATCNYAPNKQASVASTFHVTPTYNVVQVINQTVAQFSGQELLHYNDVQVNLSSIRSDIAVVNDGVNTVILNLSAIDDDTNYIRANMVTATTYDNNFSQIIDNQGIIIAQGNNIANNLTAIEAFCSDVVTSGSQLCLWVDEIRSKIADVNTTVLGYTGILSEINATTYSTYDYMTGTLATNVNNLGISIGNIASDVSTILGITQRTEANTIEINATTNTILTNQQNQVYMEVTS
jgi:hypothetical protein